MSGNLQVLRALPVDIGTIRRNMTIVDGVLYMSLETIRLSGVSMIIYSCHVDLPANQEAQARLVGQNSTVLDIISEASTAVTLARDARGTIAELATTEQSGFFRALLIRLTARFRSHGADS
jgi:hypothetical protein